jgi:hypothetical protein
MQLIHSRKALETDPIAYMQELQEFQLLWKRCLPSKDPTYSTKIKLPSSSQDNGEEALDGRALRVYHVA